MLQLQNDYTRQLNLFGVYSDAEIGMTEAGMDDKIIESVADEDIDTDDEILVSGIKVCHQDLCPLLRRLDMPNYQLIVKNMHIKGKIQATECRANAPSPFLGLSNKPFSTTGNPFT